MLQMSVNRPLRFLRQSLVNEEDYENFLDVLSENKISPIKYSYHKCVMHIRCNPSLTIHKPVSLFVVSNQREFNL